MTSTLAVNSAVHKSLALGALMRRLRPDRTYSILDLGPAIGQNVEFWSQLRCKLYLADFYSSLRSSLDPSEDAFASGGVAEKLLQFDQGTRFDIILAWDVFNYLEHAQAEALIRHLARYCVPGTFVLLLISTLQRIPDRPHSFRIIDPESILYECHGAGERECPRYLPRDINNMMEGFQVAGSFLLRHGIQEYLFVCGAGSDRDDSID